MKKIFSMMLLTAAVMVSVFTSCKSDDNESTADVLAGSYTGTMEYFYDGVSKGKMQVSIVVKAEGSNSVSIAIPEIKDLSFTAPFGPTSLDITVYNYPGFTVSNVPTIANGKHLYASKITSQKQFDDIPTVLDDTEQRLKYYGYEYSGVVKEYKMKVGSRTLMGDAVVTGLVYFARSGNDYSLYYSFRPSLEMPDGIKIVGEFTK